MIDSPVLLAPMAGVTNSRFRRLCRSYGAGLTTSEMLTAQTHLWNSRKSQLRLEYAKDEEPRSIQIAGSEPEMMAQAAALAVEQGAQIIDINMGCPKKKVCKKAAGSSLLRDETKVESILKTVVQAVDVPVTVKIRTGWSIDCRNGETIARIAEDSGVQAIAVHGRTRDCSYSDSVDYEFISRVVKSVDIPVIANGDIDSPKKAEFVLSETGAAAIMIGRAAFGQPWIFREINYYLRHQKLLPVIASDEIQKVMLRHLRDIHQFYGEYQGVRIARKQIGWYLDQLEITDGSRQEFRRKFNRVEEPVIQKRMITELFSNLNFNKK